MNNRKGSALQHGAQRGSKETNTRTLNNEIRQKKNKYQQIKSRNTKALNKFQLYNNTLIKIANEENCHQIPYGQFRRPFNR